MENTENIAEVRAFIASIYRETEFERIIERVAEFMVEHSVNLEADEQQATCPAFLRTNVCAGDDSYVQGRYYRLFDAYTGAEPIEEIAKSDNCAAALVDLDSIVDLDTQADMIEEDAAINEELRTLRREMLDK